jgi:hypothetical protein
MLKYTLLVTLFYFFFGNNLLFSQEALWELTLNESRITEMKRAPDELNYFYLSTERDEQCNTYAHFHRFDASSGKVSTYDQFGYCRYASSGTNNSYHGYLRDFTPYENGTVAINAQMRRVEYGSSGWLFMVRTNGITYNPNGYFGDAARPSSPFDYANDTLYYARHVTSIAVKSNSNILFFEGHKDSLRTRYGNYIYALDTILNIKTQGERATISRVYYPFGITVTEVKDSVLMQAGKMRMRTFDLSRGKLLSTTFWPDYGKDYLEADSIWFERESRQIGVFNVLVTKENGQYLNTSRFDLKTGEVYTTTKLVWQKGQKFANVYFKDELTWLLLNDSTAGYLQCYDFTNTLIWEQKFVGFSDRKVHAFCPVDDGYYLGGSRDGLAYLTKQAYPDVLKRGVLNRNRPDLKVYPNPTTGIFTLENPYKEAKAFLYSVSGELLSEKALNGYRDQWNVTGYSPGYYILILETPGGQFRKSISITP